MKAQKMQIRKKVREIYDYLFREYGPQGWWPLLNFSGVNPTSTGRMTGYHIGDYSYPRSEKERVEIIFGAILTQNTNWINVEKALINLYKRDIFLPRKIISIDEKELQEIIKPAGYYRQKARYLKNVSKFLLPLGNQAPTRDSLLSIKGIGEETADSILLYAFCQPEFVIDAYTKRVLVNLGMIREDESYRVVKKIFEDSLSREVIVFQEYHALLVEHAKRYYSKKPYTDPLKTAI